MRDLEASALAAWTIVFGAVYLSLAAFILEQPLSLRVGSAMWPLIAEGLGGMGLAYFGYFILVAGPAPALPRFMPSSSDALKAMGARRRLRD